MNISDCGAEHSLGQALGGRFGLPHGLTIGLVLAETMDRDRHHVPEQFERIADALGAPADGPADGSRAVRAVRQILAELEFDTLAGVGVGEADLDDLVQGALGRLLHLGRAGAVDGRRGAGGLRAGTGAGCTPVGTRFAGRGRRSSTGSPRPPGRR